MKILHRISLIIGGLSILLPLIFWKYIPEELPMHYNAAGQVDRWAEKSSLILFFFIIAILMGVMSIVVYFIKVNMESANSKEAEKSEMQAIYPFIILMNLVMQVMFAYIMLCCVTCRPLGKFFLPLFVAGISALLVLMIYKAQRGRAKDKGQQKSYKMTEKEEQGFTYRTAVDWWLGLLLGGCAVFVLWMALEPIVKTGKIHWPTLLIFFGLSVIILPLFGIKYVMYSEHLLISMSFYGKERIRYADIVGVKKTHNPLSSAAMSLNRIQIDYVENGVQRMVLISPVKRKTFIKELEEKCERSKSV